MTAKRFTFDEDVNEDYMYEMGVFSDNGKVMETTDVLNCLNELHEENNELRLQLNLCSDQRNEFHRGARENANRVGKLEKENEQLKQTVSDWSGSYDELFEDVKRLKEENEQLKSDATTLIYHNQEYRKEIESLKEENKFLQNKIATYKTGNRLLKKTLDKEMK